MIGEEYNYNHIYFIPKVLVMQHGSITHNATFDEIAVSDPRLFSSWKQCMLEASASEKSGTDTDVGEERETLKKHVQKLSIVGGNIAKKSEYTYSK